MKLIKPSEIASRIITLLEEGDERVIVVSPYVKIAKWYRLVNTINKLNSRKVPIRVYVRDDPDNQATYRDLDQLGLKYERVPHLHSKIYLNEKYGIVSSMNLLLSSEINSLEIGYVTETWEEYNDLFDFYQRYILTGEPFLCGRTAGQAISNHQEIMDRIQEELHEIGKNSWPWIADNSLHIATSNKHYNVWIGEKRLKITACWKIASGSHHIGSKYSTLVVKKVEDLAKMKVSAVSGQKPEDIQLSGQADGSLRSTSVASILKEESVYMLETVLKFIGAVDDI